MLEASPETPPFFPAKSPGTVLSNEVVIDALSLVVNPTLAWSARVRVACPAKQSANGWSADLI